MGLYYIWTTYYDHVGREIGYGVHYRGYKRKCDATRRAKQLWGSNPAAKWVVSQDNPRKQLKTEQN